MVRWIALALALGAVGAAAVAQPARTGLAPPAEFEDAATKRARLQNEMLAALKAIADKGTTGPITPGGPGGGVKGKTPDVYPPSVPGSRIDIVREGMNLFRDNNFEAARRTFHEVDPATLAPADRVFARYMLACSLRRLNKITEAEVIYRDVANSPDDEFLASCAVWQLSMIRAGQELETQIEQLRSRAKSK